MPKTIEYFNHGIREVSHRKGCHSCLDCANCSSMFNAMFCDVRQLTSLRNHKFPFDNTTCEEYKPKDE